MKMTILRELWIWMKDAVWFLRISRPGVRVPSIAPRKTSTHCVLVFLFCFKRYYRCHGVDLVPWIRLGCRECVP